MQLTIDYRGATLIVDGTYTAGDPGRLYGPPERCYPPEPATFEIQSVRVEGSTLDLAEIEWLIEPHIEAIEDACIEKIDEEGLCHA